MAKKKAGKTKKPENAGVAAAAAGPPNEDQFVELTRATSNGLLAAARECAWIADGDDASATPAERAMANVKEAEYRREQVRVMQRLLAYLGKQLTIVAPSAQVVATSKQMAESLAAMVATNVRVSVVVNAATRLLDIYNRVA